MKADVEEKADVDDHAGENVLYWAVPRLRQDSAFVSDRLFPPAFLPFCLFVFLSICLSDFLSVGGKCYPSVSETSDKKSAIFGMFKACLGFSSRLCAAHRRGSVPLTVTNLHLSEPVKRRKVEK